MNKHRKKTMTGPPSSTLSAVAQTVLGHHEALDNVIIVPIDEPYCCVGAPYECYKRDVSRYIRFGGWLLTLFFSICNIIVTIASLTRLDVSVTTRIIYLWGLIQIGLLVAYATYSTVTTNNFLAREHQEAILDTLKHHQRDAVHRAFNTNRSNILTARVLIYTGRIVRLNLVVVVYTLALSILTLSTASILTKDDRPLPVPIHTLVGINVAMLIFTSIMFVILFMSTWEIGYTYTKTELQVFSFWKGVLFNCLFLFLCLLVQSLAGNLISSTV